MRADKELDEILQGSLAARHDAAPVLVRKPGGVARKALADDDLCPICYEPLHGTSLKYMTYCKGGCGQNVHGKCMAEWVLHQKNTNRVRLRSCTAAGQYIMLPRRHTCCDQSCARSVQS